MLVIWTGTCDLTRKVYISPDDGSRKVNRFVDLSGTTPDEFIAQYQNICDLKDAYGDLKDDGTFGLFIKNMTDTSSHMYTNCDAASTI